MNVSPLYYQHQTFEDLFSLNITQKNSSTKIIMQLHRNEVNTAHLPYIVEFLKMYLPNVLLTKCFNEDNLPFHEEVRNTEIGHLFEHVLLEYLCQLKIAKGFSSASYAGRTRWNWVKDPRGKFHIRLNCGIKDADILPLAIEKTVQLLQRLLLNQQQTVFGLTNIADIELQLAKANGIKNGEIHQL